MGPTNNQAEKKNAQDNFSITLAAVVAQVGCLTLAIILAAIFGGLWLDRLLHTRPIATLILVGASIPTTLIVMLWVVRKATTRLTSVSKSKPDLSLKEDQREV